MKKGDFLWSAYRITEKQKAGKARNIKEKQLKNSRSMVSKQLVEHHSSLNVNLEQCGCGKDEVFSSSFSKIQTSETLCFWGFLSVYIESPPVSAYNKRQCVKK
jgi:hypothetical protein